LVTWFGPARSRGMPPGRADYRSGAASRADRRGVRPQERKDHRAWHFRRHLRSAHRRDPCYPLDGDDAARTAKPARRGSWKATVVSIDAGNWGTRNAELIVVHSEARGAPSWGREPRGLGVDSGQVGVFDRPHYGDDALVPKDYRWKDRPVDPKQPWCSLCCEKTLSEAGAGVVPFGAVSSSGIGDGIYDWFLWIDRGDLVGIKVLFLPE